MATSYSAVTITITPGALASGSARQSAAKTTPTSSTINLEDYRILVQIATQATTTPAGSKAIYVWIYESEDGTAWSGNAGSTDAAITLDSPHQFIAGTTIAHAVSAGTRAAAFSLRNACGGSIPSRWGIIIENQTGMSFSATTVVCQKIYNI